MPIYEYRCGKCEQVFEALQRVHDEPLDSCRRCGGPAERIISSPAIHFVGSGWYVTDYARKGQEPKGEGKGKAHDGEKDGEKGASGKKSGDEAAGAAKNGRSAGGESSGKGGAAGRGSGSGGKSSGAGAERRAGAAT